MMNETKFESDCPERKFDAKLLGMLEVRIRAIPGVSWSSVREIGSRNTPGSSKVIGRVALETTVDGPRACSLIVQAMATSDSKGSSRFTMNPLLAPAEWANSRGHGPSADAIILTVCFNSLDDLVGAWRYLGDHQLEGTAPEGPIV